MSTTAIGREAEDAAIIYLQAADYKIVAKNWRTRWCEIDIVAIKDAVTYFVEAKYRASNKWGSGFDYLTPRKLQQMQFAAQFWAATHKTRDYRLSAIELTGEPPRVVDFIKDVD